MSQIVYKNNFKKQAGAYQLELQCKGTSFIALWRREAADKITRAYLTKTISASLTCLVVSVEKNRFLPLQATTTS